MSDTRRRIEEELLDWMSQDDWRRNDARFDDLARRLFTFQFAHCPPYGRYCSARGATPSSVDGWQQIPAVPTGAFKEMSPNPNPAPTFTVEMPEIRTRARFLARTLLWTRKLWSLETAPLTLPLGSSVV